MDRFICIHGHFYQPPRENAWLEAVEWQDSAYPYHDWNERVTAECYAANAASRMMDNQRRIIDIVNNYARISFNFGPTLLAWMERNAPEVYGAIIEANRQSRDNFSGHGSALAQAFNHMIMPLANARDKHTQVLWGIHDYEHRFGGKPEGMWLPETAVDMETLDILAELGIRFTILAPHQASRVRRTGSSKWTDVSGGHVDPTMAYELPLPSGRKINLFFYDGPVSRAVAFEGLLASGEGMASRMQGSFSDSRNWAQLVHIATDGESYGHHHRHGDMALAYALHYIQANSIAHLTNYGEYLEKNPPSHQVEILENTSWSCSHGIERWRADCGCNSGEHPDWNQGWRAPLRETMNWLRDILASGYEDKARQLLKDPWAARNDYISVVLNRSSESLEQFLGKHATHQLDNAERVTALKFLELQRYAMLMFTSCGWYFDELSGIETVQVIQYAGRAIQLAAEVLGESLEDHFLDMLEKAKSNISQNRDGRHIYGKFVKPAMVDLTKVAAHYAISSLFEPYGEQPSIFCFQIGVEDYRTAQAGRARLAAGRATVTSQITTESVTLSFGVLHFGDHNVNAGVRVFQGDEKYQAMVNEVTNAFNATDFPEVIRLLDRHFGISNYSLRSLFRDEQRKVLGSILESTLSEIEAIYRNLYDQHYPLMRFLADLGNPLPRSLLAAAEFILNIDLRRAIEVDMPDADRVQAVLQAVASWGIELDAAGLALVMKHTVERAAEAVAAQPTTLEALERLEGAVDVACFLPFEVDLGKTQNTVFRIGKAVYLETRDRSARGDEDARLWVERFQAVADRLTLCLY